MHEPFKYCDAFQFFVFVFWSICSGETFKVQVLSIIKTWNIHNVAQHLYVCQFVRFRKLVSRWANKRFIQSECTCIAGNTTMCIYGRTVRWSLEFFFRKQCNKDNIRQYLPHSRHPPLPPLGCKMEFIMAKIIWTVCKFLIGLAYPFTKFQLCKNMMAATIYTRTHPFQNERSSRIFRYISKGQQNCIVAITTRKKYIYIHIIYAMRNKKKGHQHEWQLWRQLEKRDQLKVSMCMYSYVVFFVASLVCWKSLLFIAFLLFFIHFIGCHSC